MSDKIRVVLADDHPIVRSGIKATLQVDESLEVVGEAENSDATKRVCVELKPDVLLLDLSMPGASPVEILKYLREHSPDVKVLVLTASDDDAIVRQLVRVGIAGYLLKDEVPETLGRAIHAIKQGGAWFSQSIAQKFMQWQRDDSLPEDLPDLTDREQQVLKLVAKGFDNTRIANELGLAEQTVRNYASTIYEKLDVHSRAEAIVWAREKGFIEE